MTDQHFTDPLYVSRFATPDYAPEFGLYRGDEQNALAIVRGDNAKAHALVFAAAFIMLEALQDVLNYGLECNCGENGRACMGTCSRAKVLTAIAAATEDIP